MFSKIKNKLGLCTCKWCIRKAKYNISIPIIEYQGLICEEHLDILRDCADMKKIKIENIIEGDSNLKLSEFNERYVLQWQGYLDTKTDKIIYCPVDLGFKFTREDCVNSCRSCWNAAIECMKLREKGV